MIIVQLEGGLGNQMFQYVCGKALATKFKTKLVLDDRRLRCPAPRKYGLDAFKLKANLFENIPDEQMSGEFVLLEEPEHLIYNAELMQNAGKNSYLCGFWQSWKHFQNIDSLIRKNFRFTLQGFSQQCLHLAKLLQNTQSVSIHVRRTDYLKPEHSFLGVLSAYYYDRAIQYISCCVPESIFYIFSDDPDWAESNIITGLETHVVRGNTGIEDLYLMTQCKHHIIANSSFSWWGAWLNTSPDKIVLAPDVWFLGTNTKTAETDILPPDWITIEIDKRKEAIVKYQTSLSDNEIVL